MPWLAGLLSPLLDELNNTEDVLSCLTALQQVAELATLQTVPDAVSAQVLPRLLTTLEFDQEPLLVTAAMQAAAAILAAGHRPADVTQLLQQLDRIWREQQDARESGMLACILDAIAVVGTTAGAREAIAASPVLHHVAESALGRSTPVAVRVPALHALASLCGAEALERNSVPEDAQLSREVRCFTAAPAVQASSRCWPLPLGVPWWL